MRRTRGACGPPGGPPAGSPAAARSSWIPAPASKRLPLSGRGSPLDPESGLPRSTSSKAGGTGRRESSGRGRSCTPTRSGPCRPGTGPAAPPLRPSMHLVDQWQGRSHSAAMTSRRAPPDRAPRPRLADPPTPAPRCAGPPRWWCRAGHRRPPRTPDGSRPRRVSGPSPSPFAHAPQTPPRPIRVGQGAPASTGSHVAPAHRDTSQARARLLTPSMNSNPPPHPRRSMARHPRRAIRLLTQPPHRTDFTETLVIA